LIGSSAEFENDAILNREPMKRFQKWDRMEKPRRLCDNPVQIICNLIIPQIMSVKTL
jgi:hypothetical protein